MPILQITTSQTGLVGVYPRVIYILTNDTESTILTTGYLNHAVQNGQSVRDGDMALVITKTNPSAVDVSSGWYQVDFVSPNWSLEPVSSPGEVILPTIANHIATYTNTLGTLSEDPTTAISGGNIQAGLSGTAGYLASFPTTATNGSLILKAVDAGGAFNTTISNSGMAQSAVISIPDPGAPGSEFVLTNGVAVMDTGSYITFDQGNATVVAMSCVCSHQVMFITTESLTLAQFDVYAFTIVNTYSTAGRAVIATVNTVAGTNTTEGIAIDANGGAGFITIELTNLNTDALNGTVVVNVLLC